MKSAALLLFVPLLAAAQTPAVSNAKFETRAVSGDPLRYLKNVTAAESGPLWFGYAVESNRTDGNSCCWDNNCTGCRLEGGSGKFTGSRASIEPVKLEGSRETLILYRLENHVIGKIHPVSGNCPLDAGGLPFLWLTGVPASASLAFLDAHVRSASGKRDADPALVAIAMHAGDAADLSLERFSASTEPEWLREKALFWLASSRGARGFSVLQRAARSDGSDNIREKVMFDLSVSQEPQAVDELIRSAKQDSSAHVRGQALFWLAQKAGNKATAAINDAILNDPDTEVKKKAVFALQNLPKDQGVPLLIQIAKTNRNPEVRKQAMFWLGQSGDARALAFFQEVLAR